MRAALCRGTTAALVAAIVVSGRVAAHGEGGVLVTAVVESVTPSVPGLRVSAASSVAPLLEVHNNAGVDVVVLGEHGEPFLRIGAAGVFGNVRSSTLRRSADPFADAAAPPQPPGAAASRAAPPLWRRMHPRPAWRWFDHRLRIDPAAPGERFPFRVPLLVAGRPVVVHGFVRSGEIGHLRSALDRTPNLGGLEIRLLQGRIPALFVRNETGAVLEIPGLEGEPFLRIGPGGVQGNTRSPTFFRAGSTATRPVPREADPGADPRWTLLSTRSAWAWLEYRALVPEDGVRPFVLGSRSGTVARWTTPLRLAGKSLAVTGRVDWIPAASEPAEGRDPADGGGNNGWLVPLGAAVAGIGMLARLLAGRRQSTA